MQFSRHINNILIMDRAIVSLEYFSFILKTTLNWRFAEQCKVQMLDETDFYFIYKTVQNDINPYIHPFFRDM